MKSVQALVAAKATQCSWKWRKGYDLERLYVKLVHNMAYYEDDVWCDDGLWDERKWMNIGSKSTRCKLAIQCPEAFAATLDKIGRARS